MNSITITLGGYQSPASVHNRAAAKFGDLLREHLGDRVGFRLIPSVLDLGRGSGDLPKMVETGELSMCYISTVRFAEAVPEFRIFELPFIVRERAGAMRTLNGRLFPRLRHQMAERTAFQLLGIWDNGFRQITNRVRPIRRPADCRSLRIRTQMSVLHGEVFTALGFEPIAADVREFVEQIAGERFQAQDNPLTNIYHFGVHRHHRYLTLTGHFFGISAFVCNEMLFRSWPREVQDAVEQAASEATALQHQFAAAEDATILAKLDPRENEVITLGPAERAEFVAAVQPVIDRHRREIDAQLIEELGAA
jgi:TRAP-type C4-dicarboxylate transport system substrate-binding protein